MSRAWAIRRAAAASCSCSVSDLIMSECLKMAWAEAEAVNAPTNADRIIREWAAMPEKKQISMMSACIRKAAKNEIRYTTEDHYLQYSEVPAFALYGPHDFDEFISETWLRVASALDPEKLTARNEKRAQQQKRPLSLVSVVYNAARASIAAVYYKDSKHSAATDYEIENDHGEKESYTETRAASSADTSRSALIRFSFDWLQSGLDDTGKKILALAAEGYSEREIASLLGTISNVAVHKRLTKMRASLREMVG